MPEHVNIDESIRQQASNYLYKPDDVYQEIKLVIQNRIESQKTIGGQK